MSRKSKDKGAQNGNTEIEKNINLSKNKQRIKVDDNKNKQNEKKKEMRKCIERERERERLRKGQKMYLSESSKVVSARPSSKSSLPLTLKYALTYYLIASTLPLFYKEYLVGVPS
jgi:hypothetical protein